MSILSTGVRGNLRAATNAYVAAGNVRIWAVIVTAGADTASVLFTPGSGQTLKVSAVANTTVFLDFSLIGGVEQIGGCTLTVAGTSPTIRFYADGAAFAAP